ncbi:MAG: DUF3987 domain-containing protein, partial [Elainellaceae cyanobacterium]
LLYYRDELAGNIKVRNQYRGGHGADEEAELDQWTGSAVIVDRSEHSICLPRSAISRTGAVQWEVLAKLMGDHQDVNGAWSRWLFCAANAPPRYLRLTQQEEDSGIAEALTFLYTQLQQVPAQDYFLSFEAQRLFETWQHQLVDAQRCEEALGLQRVYPKIESYTARLALWLHIVNAVLRGESPTQLISGETLEKSIELAAYYLWQHRLIQTHNAPDAGLAALGLKIQKFAERMGEVSASRLKSGIRALRKTAVHQIRQLMQMLATSGYGLVKGDGSEMTYVPAAGNQQLQLDLDSSSSPTEIDVDDAPLTTPSIAQAPIEHDSQAPIDTIDAGKNSVDASESLSAAPGMSATPPQVKEPVTSSSAMEQPQSRSHRGGAIAPQQTQAHRSNEPPMTTAASRSEATTDASTETFQPQRGELVMAWIRERWVAATYIKPAGDLVFSHRTRKDDAHQILLTTDNHHVGRRRIATADLRLVPYSP